MLGSSLTRVHPVPLRILSTFEAPAPFATCETTPAPRFQGCATKRGINTLSTARRESRKWQLLPALGQGEYHAQ
jgi:hypothetical protein